MTRKITTSWTIVQGKRYWHIRCPDHGQFAQYISGQMLFPFIRAHLRGPRHRKEEK